MKLTMALLLLLAVFGVYKLVRAQSFVTSGPFQIQTPNAHTSCTVIPNSTEYCFSGDGLWESLNGAAYVQLTPGGVTSVNGQTGVVTISVSSSLSVQ